MQNQYVVTLEGGILGSRHEVIVVSGAADVIAALEHLNARWWHIDQFSRVTVAKVTGTSGVPEGGTVVPEDETYAQYLVRTGRV